ncbi:hypothetical protein BGW80DRAFT_1337926, partial [Lactifluus volemus]
MHRPVRRSLRPKFQSCYLTCSRTVTCNCTDCSCFIYHTFLFSSHLRSGPLFVL